MTNKQKDKIILDNIQTKCKGETYEEANKRNNYFFEEGKIEGMKSQCQKSKISEHPENPRFSEKQKIIEEIEKSLKLLNNLYDKLGAEPGIGNVLAEIIANEKELLKTLGEKKQ